jgi:hypothetical protein
MLNSSQMLGPDELRNLLQVGHSMLLPSSRKFLQEAGILSL